MVYISMGFDKGIESCIHYPSTMQNSSIIKELPAKYFETNKIIAIFQVSKKIPKICI